MPTVRYAVKPFGWIGQGKQIPALMIRNGPIIGAMNDQQGALEV